MINEKKFKKELIGVESIKDTLETYEEIAAMRMRKIKSNVLKNREFLSGLDKILGQVEYSYAHELEKIKNTKKRQSISSVSMLPNNGKMVSVLLSANTGLYGDVLKNIFDEFFTYIQSNNTDVLIVGKLGRKMYEASKKPKTYEYFDYSDAGFDEQNSKKLLEKLIKYQKIKVFHGFFQNILNQVPKTTDISTDNVFARKREQTKEINCLFEPSLEAVLKFFEVQILSSLVDQSIYESFLSKFASRMISLDAAVANTSKRLNQMRFQGQKLRHKKMNTNQLSVLSSMSLWNN